MVFQGIVDKIKSKWIEAIAGNNKDSNKFINPPIKDYVKVIELYIKPYKKDIYLQILLSGEKKPIDLHVQDYELIDDDDNPCIVIKECTGSKKRLTALEKDFLCGKEIPIPKVKFAYLKIFKTA